MRRANAWVRGKSLGDRVPICAVVYCDVVEHVYIEYLPEKKIVVCVLYQLRLFGGTDFLIRRCGHYRNDFFSRLTSLFVIPSYSHDVTVRIVDILARRCFAQEFGRVEDENVRIF